MKNCPKCNAPCNDNAKFCSSCGFNMSENLGTEEPVFPEEKPVIEEPVKSTENSVKQEKNPRIICLIGLAFSCAYFLISNVYWILAVAAENGHESFDSFFKRFVLILLAVPSLFAGLIISIIGTATSGKTQKLSKMLGAVGIASTVFCIVGNILVLSIFNYVYHQPVKEPKYEVPTTYPFERLPTETEYTEPTDYYEETTTTEKQTMTFGSGSEKINLWSFTDEVPKMVGQYVKQNPEFGEKYTVDCTIIATDGGAYQTALDNALVAGGDSAPDIYTAEAAFVLKYSQGDMAKFASTYKALGIDVDNKIKEADIAKYTIEVGSRDGEVVALGYQATGSAMIYNAEVAKDAFGTDDPEEIEKIVGAGSGDWNKFFESAEKLKAKGYAAVSGPEDIWNACEKSADKAWIVDGQLTIDPKREKYMDLAKTIKDKGYSNDAQSWSEAWYQDMKGEGEQKVFAFFGPAWLINYVMIGNSGGNKIGEGTYGQWRVCTPPVGFFWGGTWLLANKDTDNKEGVAELLEWITLDSSDTGLQYLWANGVVDWDNDPETKTAKDTVASATVMAKSDGMLEFCGGQNIFPAFISGNKYASAKAMTQYDETINGYFTDAAAQYAEGNAGREEAIENFKTSVYDNLSF